MDNLTLTPHYSISPTSIALYKLPDKKSGYNKKNKGHENLKDNTNYYGELSHNAKKRLRSKLDYMLYLTSPKLLKEKEVKKTKRGKGNKLNNQHNKNKGIAYKLTFITLTLPSKQNHSDNEIKKECLNQFLIELRKKHKVKNYVWKAEKQDNGNIHFHIIADAFIHWRTIRTVWNRITNKLGYVDAYQQKQKDFFKNGFKLSNNVNDKRSKKEQEKAYYVGKNCNWSDPNSTDIHAIAKIRNISAYVSKYMAKGVTKTTRTNSIDNFLSKINNNKSKITKLKNRLKFHHHTTNNYKALVKFIEKYKLENKKYGKELELLKLQGVEGRIWGCSSTLSKCKNYSDVGYYTDIPDIEIIQKTYTHSVSHPVGNQEVIVIYYDINLCPNLKIFFNEHLKSIL